MESVSEESTDITGGSHCLTVKVCVTVTPIPAARGSPIVSSKAASFLKSGPWDSQQACV